MNKKYLFAFFVVLILIALLIPFASELGDGLERTAKDLKFIEKEKETNAIFSNIFEGKLGKIFAGIIGMIIVALIALLIGKIAKRRKNAPWIHWQIL